MVVAALACECACCVRRWSEWNQICTSVVCEIGVRFVAFRQKREVVRYVNRRLEIRHITGASYHPQAQGAVERKNRTIVNLMRKFLRDHATDWELRLPALLGAVRATPMASLGGKEPDGGCHGYQAPAAGNRAVAAADG